MIRNVGGIDRGIRIVAGLAIIVAGIVMRSWWGAIGIVPLATGLVRWCPIYLPCRLSTCRVKDAPKA